MDGRGPIWKAALVRIEQNAMAASTGAVEGDPLWASRRSHQDRAIAREAQRDVVGGIYYGYDPPTKDREPLPKGNLGQVVHVCSKNGLVTPTPSLPADG